MSLKNWEDKVLHVDGAAKRVAEIEDELRLAAGLTALRDRAGVSQRELAEQMGVSQPRIVAIEKSRNVTIDVLDVYVSALGGRLEVTVVRAGRRTRLIGDSPSSLAAATLGGSAKSGSFNALNHRSRKRAKLCGISGKADGKDLAQRNQRTQTNRCHSLAKVRVAGSNPVFRSNIYPLLRGPK